MKKIVKGAICAGLALTMCAAVGCRKQNLDPEVRRLELATGALDGNFNPFTYTSANDGEMISMTQLSLFTIDKNGNIVYGDNEVCAAKDMKITMYDAQGIQTPVGDNDGTTEYVITLKKGIKFSDGVHELTMKDVLFNLYVYLDPAYTGSTTLYSTNIVGLARYRSQDPTMAGGATSSGVDSALSVLANQRIDNIVSWSEGDIPSDEVIEKDVARARELFMEEITSDWTSISSSWEESYKSYNFTEAWQAFLFAENLVKVQEKNNTTTGGTSPIYNNLNGNTTFDPDEGETYYTGFDPWQFGAIGATEYDIENGYRAAQDYIDQIEEATSPEAVQAYIEENEGATEAVAILNIQKEICVNWVYDAYSSDAGMADIVQYWATGSNLYEEILGEVRTEYYQKIKNENDGLVVPNIEGITTDVVNGNEVLKIVINGVDPKAVFNFAIPIAPLYYYSGTYNGKNYVTEADPAKNEFGVEFGDSTFFRTVIAGAEKSGVPVGAGAYKASTRTGEDNPTKATFNELMTNCYFKRNDYFETVGPNIQNAKIKYVRYQFYSDARIMEALQKGEIDFGKPNATKDNVNLVSQLNNLTSTDYETGGYGYIGINPKSVPEYKVRQAIMRAIDTTLAVTDFYGSQLAEPIYRPMSKTSWAYPANATEAYYKYDNSPDSSEIKRLMAEAGYVLKNGLYTKDGPVDGMANAETGSNVELTFTIAGESTEHPAYIMFSRAAERLNELGFKITVTTNPNALKSLISGDLDVWAAAWTSATDPDMYQVYHKDSTATSVNNWNYKNILKGSDSSIEGSWDYELRIINQLSDKIDEGRTYLERSDRIPVYADCLDLIMELAVELPTYQRHDLCVYNHNVIDSKTLVVNPNYNIGLFDKIWEINYV